MKKIKVCAVLFVLSGVMSLQGMLVLSARQMSRQIRRPQCRPSHTVLPEDINAAHSIGDIQTWFEKESKDRLLSLFNDVEERDAFIDTMQLHGKIIKKYYKSIKNNSTKDNDLFSSAVHSILTKVHLNPGSVELVSGQHLKKTWSLPSYLMRRQLSASLNKMYSTDSSEDLLQNWKDILDSSLSIITFGSVIINEKGVSDFISPKFLFSQNIKKKYDSSDDDVHQEIKYVIQGAVGQLLVNLPDTQYQLHSQLTNHYRLEKFKNFVGLENFKALLSCSMVSDELARSNYDFFLKRDPEGVLCAWYKKIDECHKNNTSLISSIEE